MTGHITLENGNIEPISRENMLLRGCQIRNTTFVEGIVLYAGHTFENKCSNLVISICKKPLFEWMILMINSHSLNRWSKISVVFCDTVDVPVLISFSKLQWASADLRLTIFAVLKLQEVSGWSVFQSVSRALCSMNNGTNTETSAVLRCIVTQGDHWLLSKKIKKTLKLQYIFLMMQYFQGLNENWKPYILVWYKRECLVVLSLPISGKDTKALMNNSGPRYKRSSLEVATNRFIIYCVLILVGMCLFAGIASTLWLLSYKPNVGTVIFVILSTKSPLTDGILNLVSAILNYQVSVYSFWIFIHHCGSAFDQRYHSLEPVFVPQRKRSSAMDLSFQ